MTVEANRTPLPNRRAVHRALISVSDKTGLDVLGKRLSALGVEILSTGGTAKALKAAGLKVTDVTDVTGFPEIMDGRVKTLHPSVHGGLLAIRDDAGHRQAMEAHGIEGIDLLVVDLYPFEKTRASGADAATIVENVDIGGPAMIRAGAKNHGYVTVVTDTADYEMVLAHLEERGGRTELAFRREMAARAFARTAAYDGAVAAWFAETGGEAMPRRRSFAGTLAETLRYGENPHQSAGFYRTGETRPGVATARQVQGKPLSYNNINDTDAAFELAAEFDPQDRAAVVIVKHANPCGVATGETLLDAYGRALACDPVSAFGGIVAVNRRLDAATAEEIAKLFTEVVIAPEAEDGAIEALSRKGNLRVLLTGGLPDPAEPGTLVKSVAGGLLVQTRDNATTRDLELRTVTRRKPTEAEMADLLFAFRVAKHVKSNAIVYAREGATVGIGAGQMSRVDSARIAARKAEDAAGTAGLSEPLTLGSVVASDAFFPFADGLLSAVEAGARAVIQPGGSMRDEEVIAAADAHDIAMVMTGVRHFRH